MKRFYFFLMAIAIIFASCNGNDKSGQACYEIEVQFATLSVTEMFYGDEDELQAEVNSLREKYKAMGFEDEAIKIYPTKLKKSKDECTQPEEIVRIVKPTASFKMSVKGINPEGYNGSEYDGAAGISSYAFSCRYVQDGGHSSSPMMELMHLSNGLQHSYTDDSWGSNNYVHDNSYVGGRIVSISSVNGATENPTEAEKDFIRDYISRCFIGSSYDMTTGQTTYYDLTPNGPFKLKKTCQWTFRNGRGSTFSVTDEIIDTYQNSEEFVETVISHSADNPLFQSLYYYDAEKDEFILQDRTSWNLK